MVGGCDTPAAAELSAEILCRSGRHRCARDLFRLGKVFAEIRDDKKVLWFLAAFFFYIDGVYAIIEMATSYGKTSESATPTF